MIKRIFGLGMLSLVTLIGCGQKKDPSFLNKVVNDFSRNSYFILINVTSSNQASSYLIENDDLFFYFHQIKNFSEEEYKKNIQDFLNDNSALNLTNDEIKRYGFIKLTPSESVSEVAKKGKEFFVNKYFKNKLLKDGITVVDKYNIVKFLYNWNIASKIDDETGYLIIVER